MLRKAKTRTGIDLGDGSVKIVCGEGTSKLERISRAGIEEYAGSGSNDRSRTAAAALARLLDRLSLNRGRLGRIAVAVGGKGVAVGEILLPALSETELRRALPFEARKHLFLEGIEDPELDCQILGPAPNGTSGSAGEVRVLLAAASRSRRDFVVRTLELAGLEPEVVDLEPLASLNALLAHVSFAEEDNRALALLDLGAHQTALHLAHPEGGLLTRQAGDGTPPRGNPEEEETYADQVATRVKETLTYYRGRQRQEVGRVYLAGGGSLRSGIVEPLESRLGLPLLRFDPFERLGKAAVGKNAPEGGPRFVTAYGLSRWWDGSLV